MDEYETQRALIESAMSGVRIVVCPLCGGLGELPQGLHIECPRCEGKGESVESVQESSA